MEQEEHIMKFAVLIDSENISSRYASIIFNELDKYGFASCRRIYGNWSRVNGWKEDLLLEYSLIPIQQFSYTSGKNSTDMALVIDAMDLLYRSHVDAFCLVTSDSDFTRLAMKLREEQKYVLGMGVANTPVSLKKSCNRFINLDIIYEQEKEREREHVAEKNTSQETTDITSIGELQSAVLDIINVTNGEVDMGMLGSRLSQKYNDFDVRNYGYSKLSVFITQEMKNISVEKKNNRMIVYALDKTNKQDVEQRIQKILMRNKGKVDNLSIIKRELEKEIPHFDIDEYGYSRFSSFLRSFKCLRVETNKVKLIKK